MKEYIMTDEEIRTDNTKTLINALERIAELEKENAELKKEVEVNEDLAAVAYMQGAENQKKKADRHLAKAKEHIHRLLVLLTEGKRSYAVIDEARAFMQEASE